MAVPILWAPGIFWFFLLENPHAHKIPPCRGGSGFLEGSANFIFMGAGFFFSESTFPVQRQILRTGHVPEKIARRADPTSPQENLCETCAGASKHVRTLCAICTCTILEYFQCQAEGGATKGGVSKCEQTQTNADKRKQTQTRKRKQTQANASKLGHRQTNAYTPLFCGFLHPPLQFSNIWVGLPSACTSFVQLSLKIRSSH